MQTFSELAIRKSLENLSHVEHVNATIVGALDIMPKPAPARSLPNYLKYFLEKYENDTSLA